MRTRIVAVSLLLGSVVLGGCGQTDAPAHGTTTRATAVHQIDAGRGPIGIAASGSDDVWIASAGDDRVLHLPAGAARPDAQVAVAGTPLRLTLAEQDAALWVSAFR